MKKLWLAMSVSALCAANVHASEWGYEGAHGLSIGVRYLRCALLV